MLGHAYNIHGRPGHPHGMIHNGLVLVGRLQNAPSWSTSKRVAETLTSPEWKWMEMETATAVIFLSSDVYSINIHE